MAYELGVAVIHGIGRQNANFAEAFVAEVNRRLGSRAPEVCWMPIWWADLVEPKESDLLERLSAGGRLDWKVLRSFVVHFLADAVAYQRVPGESGQPGLYVQLHLRVADRLEQLRAQLQRSRAPDAGEPPLLVIAHSLGGHIMSNYVWDHQHPTPARGLIGDLPFVRGETLTAMVTFGCNIPLFTLALPRVVPIAIPGTLPVSPPLKPGARWLNLYDADDVLGYPLRPLDGYADLVDDREVNVGNALTSWNPAAHNAYWTDNNVTKPISELIAKLLGGSSSDRA